MKIKVIYRDEQHGLKLATRFDGLSITPSGEITNEAGKIGTPGTQLTNGGEGGVGKGALVLPRGGFLYNGGLILGGAGGDGGVGYSTTIQYHGGTDGGAGGSGGLGAILSAYGSIRNFGSLTGGAGGAGGAGGIGGAYGANGRGGGGGDGGNGLVASFGASLENAGLIAGGAGGAAGAGGSQLAGNAGGRGGAGVILSSSKKLINQGMIAGGAGGDGGSELGSYGGPGGYGGAGGFGVQLQSFGTVDNGGAILGGDGGIGGSVSQGVLNSPSGNGGNGAAAFVLSGGGVLTNSGTVEGGRGGDAGAYGQNISGIGGGGGDGVDLGGYGTVINSGLISGGKGGKAYQVNGGIAGRGIQLSAGGIVTNGSGADNGAVISGYWGIALYGAGTVTNYGAIESLGGAFFGTTIGVDMAGAGTIDNFGTIEADNVYAGETLSSIGVSLYRGGTVINGSPGDHSALIAGYIGISGGGDATIENFGVISGSTGVAMTMRGSDRLVAEAGSSLTGIAMGGGGTLELAAASGQVTWSGSSGEVSGSIDMSFSGFGAYVIDSGGQWRLEGANTLYSAQSLTLDTGATLTLASGALLFLEGASVLSGTVNGVGTISVTSATVGDLTIGGTDRLRVAGSVVQTGPVTLGDASTDAATLAIDKGGVWSLGAGNIARGAASGSRIINSGLLIGAAGAGIESISVVVADFGVVEASSGTLELSDAVTGAGKLKIDTGATLQLAANVGVSLTVSFNGENATLAINRPSAFKATISGLAISDAIDLVGAAATGASVNTSDQLVIINGSRTVATLQLSGNYAGAGFSVESDGHGGTDVALAATAAAPLALATAMAAFGAGASATASDIRIDHGASHRNLLVAIPGSA